MVASMDVTALATASAAATTAQTQMAVAGRIMKMNADAGAAVADLLTAAAENLKAMLPAGVGGNLDVAA